MSLRDLIVSGVDFANTFTKNEQLQAKVTWNRFDHESGSGEIVYQPSLIVDALIDWKQKQVRTPQGILTVSRAAVTFLDPAIQVDDQDQIILPDGSTGPLLPNGTTGPILDEAGFIDGATGHPYLTTVYLG
jgi:hypothetical protein